MEELTKIKDGLYAVSPKFRLTDEQQKRCYELFGKGFGYGWVKAPELGTDGHVYMTEQLAIRLPKDSDLIVFKMVLS